jgi:DivIVA domain-containing protein
LVDADPGIVYLLESAKDRLAKDFPGYRIADVDTFFDGALAAVRGGEPPSPSDVRAVTFPLTKWRVGYAQRDVDRLIGELTQLLSNPGSGADAPPDVHELVDRIVKSKFGTTYRSGYAEEEVDAFLDRIIGKLMQGERGTIRTLAGEAQFRMVRLRPGYATADVDSLLEEVEEALADLGG